MTFNVNTVTYIVDDGRLHSALDDVSALPFESYIHVLNKDLRNSLNLVAQICHRIEEQRQITSSCCDDDSSEPDLQIVRVRKHIGFHVAGAT